MPRHGDEHSLPPHRINYRANVWAMRQVGVRRIIGPSACGSLKPELPPGTFVVCDQFVDRTAGREDTFYDGPLTTHVSAADPYCTDLGRPWSNPPTRRESKRWPGAPWSSSRARASRAGRNRAGLRPRVGRREHDPVPRCWLARELGLCYANVSLVTDYDVGLEGMPEVEPVSADTAFEVFRENLDRLRALLLRAVPKIGPQPDDACASALDHAIVHH